MGIWTWIKDVVAERGEHESVPIFIERQPGGGYAFRLGVQAGFGGQEVARIPVRVRPNEEPHPLLKEIHWCELAGQTIEAANLYALRDKVALVLDTIAPGRALPLVYFRVPEMDYELPVYEDDGHLVVTIVAGPRLRARDFGGIRRLVCEHLVSGGYVHDADDVVVGVLRPRDLSRVPPAAVFRSLADGGLWLPSVEGSSPDGPVVGVLGHAPQLRGHERLRAGAGPQRGQTAPAAEDVVGLLRYLRSELARAHAIADPDSLYACDVRREIWAVAEERLEDAGLRLVAYLEDDERSEIELPVLRSGAGDVAIALEDRGINVFLSPTVEALASQVGLYLAKSGFLRFAQEVEIHATRAPRAERLEAEEIWTYGDGLERAFAATPPDGINEEVQA